MIIIPQRRVVYRQPRNVFYRQDPASGLRVTGSVSLDPDYDLGSSNSDNVSNYKRPGLFIEIDSGTSSGAVVTITVDGTSWQTHTLNGTDITNGGFSVVAASDISDGSHIIAGTVNDGGNLSALSGFTYTVDTSISQPSVTGDATTTNTTPTYPVTFGATAPQSGDTLVLLVDNVQNATKTLGAGDLSSTTVTGVALGIGPHSITVYVYGSGDRFSPISDAFSQTVTNGPSYTFIDSADGTPSGAFSHSFDLGSHAGNYLVVIGVLDQNKTVTGLTIGGTDAGSVQAESLNTRGIGCNILFFAVELPSTVSGAQTFLLNGSAGYHAQGISVWIVEGYTSTSVQAYGGVLTSATTNTPLSVLAGDLVFAVGTINPFLANFSSSSVAPTSTHSAATDGTPSADFLIAANASLTVAGGGSSGCLAVSFR